LIHGNHRRALLVLAGESGEIYNIGEAEEQTWKLRRAFSDSRNPNPDAVRHRRPDTTAVTPLIFENRKGDRVEAPI
jgi:hypothetical protein